MEEAEPKKKRLSLACNVCRRKKIKCDGTKPTCDKCRRFNQECSYTTIIKKRGPRQGHIELLEQRLKKMEELMTASKTQESSNNNNNNKDGNSRISSSISDNNSSITAAPVPVSTAAPLPLLMPSTSLPPPPLSPLSPHQFNVFNSNKRDAIAMSDNTNSNSNQQQGMNVQQQQPQLPPILASPYEFPATPIQQQQQQQSQSQQLPLPQPMSLQYNSTYKKDELDLTVNGLPPDDVIEHLVDLYFQHLKLIQPILDAEKFKTSVRNKTCSLFLLYSVLSAAARYSNRPDVAENPLWMSGEKYAKKARALLPIALDDSCIETICGLFALVINEYGCARGPRCWTYSGIVIRMILELGLNEERIFDEPSDIMLTLDQWYWYETRRRLYWGAFIHDKNSSASTGRPQMLDSADADVLLPVDSNILDQSEFYQTLQDGSRIIRYRVFRNETMSNGGGGEITGIQATHMDLSLPENRNLDARIGFQSRITEEFILLGKVTRLINRGYKTRSDAILPAEYEEFEKLDTELEDWAKRLPLNLRNTPANLERYTRENTHESGMFLVAHMIHNSLLVLLHRPTLVLVDMPGLTSIPQALQDRIHRAVEKCLAAADDVMVLLKYFGYKFDLLPPYVLYLTYTTGTVMVNSTFSLNLNERLKAEAALNEIYNFFMKMRVHWAMSDKLFFLLRDLSAIHQKVLKGVLTQTAKTPKSTTVSSDGGDSSNSYVSPSLQNTNTTVSSNHNTDWTINTSNSSNSSTEMNDRKMSTANIITPPSSANMNPLAHYQGSIPPRRLPLADVSLSSSDWTNDFNWQENNENGIYSTAFQTVGDRTTRSTSLFGDSNSFMGLTAFDVWLQHQQQQIQQPKQGP